MICGYVIKNSLRMQILGCVRFQVPLWLTSPFTSVWGFACISALLIFEGNQDDAVNYWLLKWLSLVKQDISKIFLGMFLFILNVYVHSCKTATVLGSCMWFYADNMAPPARAIGWDWGPRIYYSNSRMYKLQAICGGTRKDRFCVFWGEHMKLDQF